MWTGLLHGGNNGTFLNSSECAIDEQAIKDSGAGAAVYGIPFDATTISRSGANWGPRGLRDASRMATPFNSVLGVDIAEDLGLVDVGDCDVALGNTVETMRRATDDTARILRGGAVPVIMGGDHSITIGTTKAVAEHVSGNVGMVLIDTHLDTARDVGGEKYTHCSPVPRAIEAGLSAGSSVLIGMSGWLNPREELDYCQENGITVIWLEEIWENGVRWALDKAYEVISTDNPDRDIYLSFDIDALDAAHAPATCVPTTAGMTAREGVTLVRALAKDCRLRAFDVAEVGPSLEGNVSPGITAAMGARLMMEAMGGVALARQGRRSR